MDKKFNLPLKPPAMLNFSFVDKELGGWRQISGRGYGIRK